MYRVIDRDPICGLGLGPSTSEAAAALEGRQRAAREPENRNPILGEGNLGEEVKMFARMDGQKSSRATALSNPLGSQPAEGGDWPDDLRPSGRPGKARTEPAQHRDPIAGNGEFGVEWDPVHLYAGRRRQQLGSLEAWHSSRSNPVTGEGVASYEINQELRAAARKSAASGGNSSNPLTGENCRTYSVSNKLNEKYLKAESRAASGNPLTGENCRSQEQKSMVPRKDAGPQSNPVTGENCQAYSYNCSEFKHKEAAALNARNPLTGDNCQAFTVNAGERDRARTTDGAAARCNPVTGEGCQSYVLAHGEKRLASLRAASANKDPGGNPLTGENLATFDVHREQRANCRVCRDASQGVI